MVDVTQQRSAADMRRATLGEGMDHTPPSREFAVRAAERHTARVKFLRRAAIAGSVIIVSVIALVAIFDPFHRLLHGISVADVGVEGSVVTMQSPKISGLRQDGGAYAITAAQGVQDITKPNLMELRGLDATLGMSDNSSSRITADIGVYDGKADTMALAGHARIKNTGGYDLLMQSATMNFKTGLFSSREPLKVTISGGIVAAQGLDITESGHKVSFTGGVDSTFDPPDQPDTDEASAASPSASEVR